MFRRNRITASRKSNRIGKFRSDRLSLQLLEDRSVPATISVTNNNDLLTTGDGVSLREAIESFNLGAPINADVVASGPAFGTSDSITFSGVTSPISLPSGQLLYSKATNALTITGPGSGLLTIQNTKAASTTSSVFSITGSGSTLSMSGLTITGGNSTATGGGGILFTTQTVNLTDVVVTGNSATTGGGGGIRFNSGNLNATNSTISLNTTTSGNGGGIYFTTGNCTIVNCSITSNSTTNNGSSKLGDGGAIKYSTGKLDISGSKINNNSAVTSGTSANGGAFYRSGAGTFILTDSTMSGNSAGADGGAVYLYNAGTTTILRSTLSNNVGNLAGISGEFGGGAMSTFGGTITITNSTISGNTSVLGKGGAFIFYGSSQVVSVRNTTIAFNSAGGVGGGIHIVSGSVTLSSTIVSDNTSAAGVPDINGIVNTANQSLISNDTGTTITNDNGTIHNFSANLGPLALNGGTTANHIPGPGPAINAGNNAFALTTDQRGLPRVQGAGPDIGSVETPDPAPSGIATSPDVTVAGGTSQLVTVVYTDINGSKLINRSSIGTGDITISGPGGFTTTPAFVSANSAVDAASITVTYSFTPPNNAVNGKWDNSENGVYDILMVASQVFDKDSPTPFAVGAGKIGSFLAAMPIIYTVDEATDFDDADYSVGHLSIREAISLANNDSAPSQIIFSNAAFSGATTIAITAGEMAINQPTDIVGPTARLTLDALNANRHFNTMAAPTGSAISFSRMVLTNGKASGSGPAGYGGAILVGDEAITIDTVALRNNSASTDGGAIGFYSSPGSISIISSELSGNTANSSGGAVYTFSTNQVLIRNSTISGNLAKNGTGGGFAGSSWALTSSFTMTNSTMSLNRTGIGGNGGAIRVTSGAAPLNIESCVISGNTGSPTAPQISAGTVNLTNSLIESKAGFTLGTNSGNLADGTNPLLAPLADYGGITFTHGLFPGSPLVNAGSNPVGLTTDQRGAGFPRQVGPAVDIGSVEGILQIPTAALTPLGPIVTAGATPNKLDVVYSDNNAINVSTIDISDIEILDPSSAPLTITGVSVSPAGNGTPRTATYTFLVPGGAWDVADNGTYTVNLKAGAVSDTDSPTPNSNLATALGTFKVAVPVVYLVDKVDDADDGIYTAGELTLREAINLANNDLNPSVINFSPSVFNTTKTISMGGEMDISEGVTINGPASGLVLDANFGSRILKTDMTTKGDAVSLSHLQFINGLVVIESGGGIFNVDAALTLTDCTVSNCETGVRGGGIYSDDLTSLTLTNTTISNNRASTTASRGGGLHIGTGGNVVITNSTISGNTSGEDGGAIYFYNGGSLNMNGSTFSGNVSGAAATGGSGGGAIYFWGVAANIRNSTISGNTANKGNGGALLLLGNTSLTLKNSTVAFNQSVLGSGGAIFGTSTATLNSVILSNNSAAIAGPNVNGAVNADFCLFDNTSGATINGANNQLNKSANLSPLNNYGGPTATHGLLPGSFAVNNGSNSDSLSFDQRGPGFPRQVGAAVDIGAFEGILPIPSGTLTPLGPITVAGATPNTVSVVYTDDTGINVSSIGINDIEILDKLNNPLTITGVSVNPSGNGTPRTATYTFTVPGGSWDQGDDGTYTVNLKAGQITDIDTPTPNTNVASTLGTFKVAIPIVYTVDKVDDVDDGLYTTGELTLREAIGLANSDSSPSQIQFNPTAFAGTKTILQSTELLISEGVTITGPAGGLILDGVGSDRVLEVNVTTDGDAISISNLTLQNGAMFGSKGGGILNWNAALSMSKVNVLNCTTDNRGAGIAVFYANASLSLTDCTISGNKTTNTVSGGFYSSGGGIIVFGNSNISLLRTTVSGNEAGESGGGIYFFSGGTLTMMNSTISGNTGNTSGDLTTFGSGGIYLYNTTTLIQNSTISGNVSLGPTGDGGGISIGQGSATIINSTIAFNSAGGVGGGIRVSDYVTLNMTSTIVSNNSAASGGPDINGEVNANFCLISDTSDAAITGANNKLNVSPSLAPLANNGGPTQTHAITNLSPAYNAGSNTAVLAFDQRGSGFNRTSAGQTDIGAFELQVPAKVAKVDINQGAASRSRVLRLDVSFDTVVTFSGAPVSAFQLKRQSDNAVVNLSAVVTNGSTSVVTLTFLSGPAVDFSSLADGRYTLTIDSTKVSASGFALDGDSDGNPGGNYVLIGNPSTNKLFRLFGDADGNGLVDGIDFGAFRGAFNTNSSIFDFDGSGIVDGVDFGQFRSRFGVSI